MNNYVQCTTMQGNTIMINLDKVFYFRKVGGYTLVYVHEKEFLHVQESIEEIFKLSKKNKASNMAEEYRRL